MCIEGIYQIFKFIFRPISKLFASNGNEIRGYTKKGKLFLGFDTNMTETISSMSITGNELCVAAKHVFNQYTDCKDANNFLSEDIITDVLALPGEKVSFTRIQYKHFCLIIFAAGSHGYAGVGLPGSLFESAEGLKCSVFFNFNTLGMYHQ
jgi:hypothetical protein